MKPLKKAKQQNVALNKEYYTEAEIANMLNNLEIEYLSETFDPEQKRPVIYTEDIKDLKIVLDEYGYYTTVAVKENGKRYYINL